MRITTLFFALCGLLFLTQCKKNKKDDELTPEDDSFDKSGMLANIGENIIIPAYADFKIAVDSLSYYSDQFKASPSLSTLQLLQQSFIKSYSHYQYISLFEFGPADAELIRANFNTFPCDTSQINSKIATSDFNISTIADLDAKGFPAIDFLLYRRTNNTNEVIARFTTDTNAAAAKSYLTALVNELKSKADVLNSGWSASGGNYINTFKTNTASNVGSPIGMLVNQLSFDLELLKNAKIGIPAGKKSMETPLPEKAEAVYSSKSLLLAAEHLKSLENVYLGRNKQNADGLGFDDYLVTLGTPYSTGTLNDAIKNKFVSAKAKLAAIPETLSQSVINNATAVTEAYNELQQLVVLIKVDMTSALGVSITYQDNDGD